ncbi:MAG: threonine synthase [Parvularcula sp.]|jgi:threonine synthase|nr:threonine synthase [Parvularcula sp.]
MRYLSTRGQSPLAPFDQVLTDALAPDGGLYVPEAWPARRDWSALEDKSFESVAAEVLAIFAEGDIDLAEARRLTDAAYREFRWPERVFMSSYGVEHVLELFHGPTLAFKDVAMQLIARLFERSLQRSGSRMSVVVATSGDTGGAAVSALAGRDNVSLCVLHPYERISHVQRRFMTSSGASNILNLAVEGTFDDCQAIVKDLFADRDFASDVSLGGVNSINWARIAAQAAYYITASLAVYQGEPVHFSVPTGNFGDVFAGYVARQLGAPVGRLIVAVNDNDILDRALRTGNYVKEGIRSTSSPSMDIEVASNFERAIFEMSGRDAELTRGLMEDLKRNGGFVLPLTLRDELTRVFSSYKACEADAAEVMSRMADRYGILVDPHTAVGLYAAGKARDEGVMGPIVTLSTAHPAKFPDAVYQATHLRAQLPGRENDLFKAREEYKVVPASLDKVKTAIREQAHR